MQDDDDYIEDYGSSLITCPPFWHLAHSFLPQTRPETKSPHSLIKICKAEDDRDFHDEDESGLVNEHEGGFLVMIRVSHFSIEAFLEELERRNSCVHTRTIGFSLLDLLDSQVPIFIGESWIANIYAEYGVDRCQMNHSKILRLIHTINKDTINWEPSCWCKV